MTLIWLPMIWLLVKIVVKIIPDGKKGMQLDPYGVKYLDNRLISQPAAALELVAKEVLHCGHIVQEMLGDLSKAVSSDDRKRLDEVRKNQRRLPTSIRKFRTIWQICFPVVFSQRSRPRRRPVSCMCWEISTGSGSSQRVWRFYGRFFGEKIQLFRGGDEGSQKEPREHRRYLF